jgi:hypothetical protein
MKERWNVKTKMYSIFINISLTIPCKHACSDLCVEGDNGCIVFPLFPARTIYTPRQ